MSYIVRPQGNLPKPPAWTVDRPDQNINRRRTLDIVTRRYDICWIDPKGEISRKSTVGPAMPVFEQAFSAFAQGTLIQTSNGLVAVEDLQPGDLIATGEGRLQKLLWIGAMTVFPNQAGLGLPPGKLYRITDGSFGHDRQSPDLVLGAGARILPGPLAIDSSSPLLDPESLADGQSVIAINPVSQIRVFHLALASHSLVRANGILCESYHPGIRPNIQLNDDLYVHFCAMFPHLENLEEFGPLNHRRAS